MIQECNIGTFIYSWFITILLFYAGSVELISAVVRREKVHHKAGDQKADIQRQTNHTLTTGKFTISITLNCASLDMWEEAREVQGEHVNATEKGPASVRTWYLLGVRRPRCTIVPLSSEQRCFSVLQLLVSCYVML